MGDIIFTGSGLNVRFEANGVSMNLIELVQAMENNAELQAAVFALMEDNAEIKAAIDSLLEGNGELTEALTTLAENAAEIKTAVTTLSETAAEIHIAVNAIAENTADVALMIAELQKVNGNIDFLSKLVFLIIVFTVIKALYRFINGMF